MEDKLIVRKKIGPPNDDTFYDFETMVMSNIILVRSDEIREGAKVRAVKFAEGLILLDISDYLFFFLDLTKWNINFPPTSHEKILLSLVYMKPITSEDEHLFYNKQIMILKFKVENGRVNKKTKELLEILKNHLICPWYPKPKKINL